MPCQRPTGSEIPVSTVTVTVTVVDTGWFKEALIGALFDLGNPETWIAMGDFTPEEAAQLGAQMVESITVS